MLIGRLKKKLMYGLLVAVIGSVALRVDFIH